MKIIKTEWRTQKPVKNWLTILNASILGSLIGALVALYTTHAGIDEGRNKVALERLDAVTAALSRIEDAMHNGVPISEFVAAGANLRVAADAASRYVDSETAKLLGQLRNMEVQAIDQVKASGNVEPAFIPKRAIVRREWMRVDESIRKRLGVVHQATSPA